MKRVLTLVVMALLLAMGAQARTYVLCIGVSNYPDARNNTTQTTKDVKDFKAVMEHYTKNITILTSKYANKENILEKLSALCNRAQKGDNIVVFYSGHGYPGGMFVYDGELPYEKINDLFAKSDASAKIMFVNACHSGSVKEVTQDASYPTPGENIIYLMSSRADEYSFEQPVLGHGLYTQALLKGLRGKADANGDKKVTVKELFTYVYNDVQHSNAKSDIEQHPQLIGSKAAADAVVIDWN